MTQVTLNTAARSSETLVTLACLIIKLFYLSCCPFKEMITIFAELSPGVGTSQHFPLQQTSDDEGGTPGRPGIDYPILTTIPTTSFDCKTQRYKGFFADPETRCQVTCNVQECLCTKNWCYEGKVGRPAVCVCLCILHLW